MHLRQIATPVLIALAAATAAAQSYLPTQGQVVAANGDNAPGLSGVTIGGTLGIDTPSMDLNGNMVFRAGLGGSVGTTDNRALFYGRTADDLIILARAGDPEPSGTIPGATLNSSATGAGINGNPRISPTGNILVWTTSLFGGSVQTTGNGSTGANNTAVYWGPPGVQTVLARRGDLTPGGGGSFLDTFSFTGQTSALNASGSACFQAGLVGGDVVTSPGNNSAWLVGAPGSLAIMLRKGDLFPVVGGDALIGSLGFNVQINEVGQVFHDEKFSTTLGTAPATAATDGLLMLYTPGSGNLIVAREGDPAPGTAGASYNSFTMATSGLSRSGRMAFYGSLIGGDVVGTTNDGAIYTGTAGGGFTMAVRRGDPAPTGPSDTFASIYTSSINLVDSGAILFYSVLAGPSVTTDTDASIWVGTPGNFTMIAREGDPAPGIANAIFATTTPGTAHLNDRGQVIFGCSVLIQGTTSASATYAYDPNQGLILLSTAGDIYMTSTGPATANGVDGGLQFNSGDGCPQTLNNNGEFVRKISTGNGVGAVVRGMIGGLQASPASIPATGGTQTLAIDAGIANANRFYVLAGTLSGTRPGFNFGGQSIPLNQDVWFPLSLQAANSAAYTNTWGLLDANGHASASFNYPAGFAWLQGYTFHHAFVVIDTTTVLPSYVSQPASLRLY
jgi:hypothetical protein